MDPLDTDELAEKISEKISNSLRVEINKFSQKMTDNIDDKFANLQQPVSQAVTAQYAIGAGVGGVFLLFALYTLWQCYHKREITHAFRSFADKQDKLEHNIQNSQRDMAYSVSSTTPQSPRYNMV